MPISISLTDEEQRLASSYARIHSISLGDAFKQAFFERLEDESRPIEELWEECGL